MKFIVKNYLLTFIISLSFFSVTVLAQGGDGLKGEYYTNVSLSGTPLIRYDKNIDFDFAFASPLTGIDIDNFSIRWTGKVQAPVTGSYTFTSYSDDGIRVWVNGVKLIDNWTGHGGIYDDGISINLVAGQKYDIKIEYYEGNGYGQLQMYWAYPGTTRTLIPQSNLFSGQVVNIPTRISGNGSGLRAEYFQNVDLYGTPVLIRHEAQIENDYGTGSPASGIWTDWFSIRWTGEMLAPITENITFTSLSDDGFQLYVNDKLVISNWSYHATTTNNSEPFPVIAGQRYSIRAEYFDGGGNATAKLHWSFPGQTDQAIPAQYLYPATSGFVAPLEPQLALTPENQDASRFLMQATYGPTHSEISNLRAKGYEGWLTEQFNLPQSSHVQYMNILRDEGRRIYGEQFNEAFWTFAVTGRDQLRQRMAFSLSQIFVISQLGGTLEDKPFGLATYYDMLGRNAFGNYRQLLEDVTLHPAMGKYLDMLANEKEDATINRIPNENYAREILQLFSIGLYQLNLDGSLKLDALGKPIPTYDNEEVKGFARVFTGWNWGGNATRTDSTWNFPPKQYDFSQPMQSWVTKHSTGEKLLLNGAIAPSGQTPEKDLKDALDNIFNHPNVGVFIGKQLIQRLVTSNPSQQYISRVASVFNNNGSGVRGDMKAVTRAILMDSEARMDSRAGYGIDRVRTSRGNYNRQSNRSVTQPIGTPNVEALTEADSGTIPGSVTTGKLREPILRYAHLLRAFDAQSIGGRYRFQYIDGQEWGTGQSALKATSVFNFFEPDYSLPGAITTAGALSPEFKLANETSIIGNTNFTRDTIYGGMMTWTGFPITLNHARYLGWINDPGKMVDQLNLVMMGGAMTGDMKASIVRGVNGVWDGNPGEKLKSAIFLVATSKEYVIQK